MPRVALLIVAAAAQCLGQGPNLRAVAQLVMVDCLVQSRPGGPLLSDLRASDFVVSEAGSPREVSAFEVGDLSLDLIVIVDVNGPRLSAERSRLIIEALSGALRDGDRLRVLSANGQTVSTPLTSQAEFLPALSKAFRDHSGKGQSLWAEVLTRLGSLTFESSDGRRPALVILTHDTAKLGGREVAYAARQLEHLPASLAAITTPYEVAGRGRAHPVPQVPGPRLPLPGIPKPGSGGSAPRNPTGSVNQVMARSGGEMLDRAKEGEVREYVRRLRNRYVLGFVPRQDGPSYRSISIRLTSEARERFPDAVVRHRLGYFFE